MVLNVVPCLIYISNIEMENISWKVLVAELPSFIETEGSLLS
jgi:hypothetical protein